MSAARRARARVLRAHLEAGTYSPSRNQSGFTRCDLTEAMAQDISERPRLPPKVRDPNWAFHDQEPPPVDLIQLLTP